MINKNRYLYYSILPCCLLLIVIGVYAYGWETPGCDPPGCNLPAPINAGPDPQTKTGNLTIDSLLKVGRYSSAPTGATGSLYYDTTDNEFKGYKENGWDSLGGGEVLWGDITNKPTTVASYGITDMGSQNVNYAVTAGSVSNIGDKNCTWVATAQATADYTCGSGKYMRGIRFAGFENNSNHTHSNNALLPGCSGLGCQVGIGSSGAGPVTIFLVSQIECCTL